ncbi:MAG: DUF484 family protein, partial [Gammaproteobacteria bacterium]
MTSQQPSTLAPDSLSEEEVVRFLIERSDFFDRHPELLAQLELTHESGEGAISLIERQLSVLREQNRKLDRQLKELISVARSNHELSDKVHRLAMRLIEARDAAT